MNDMKAAIIPKSDQLNADDLLTGPITIKITGVTVRGGQEQPVAISYEGDQGKPYKACKSMCRVLVSAWGADSAQYVGRSLTLYCDPSVKWGGMAVGGIRISHMSDIPEALTMALTATKGNKKPFTVRPIVAADPAATISADQVTVLVDMLAEKGIETTEFLAKSKLATLDALPVARYKGALEWIDGLKSLKG